MELAVIATLAAGAVGAAGTLMEGKAAQEDAYFQAAQLKAKGKEEFAASQRAAGEKRHDTSLALSRSQALAAKSGAGVGGSVLENDQDLAARGEMLALDELYKGKQRKAGLYDQAKAARRTGLAARRGSYLKAGGTLLESVSSAYGVSDKSKSMFGPGTYG